MLKIKNDHALLFSQGYLNRFWPILTCLVYISKLNNILLPNRDNIFEKKEKKEGYLI